MKQTRPTEYAEDGSILNSGLEEVHQSAYAGHFVQSDNVDFISPVDGTRIDSKRKLDNHNRQHGVSNDLDSLREQTQKASQPKTLSPRERKNQIADAYERASSSGFSRRVEYDE